LTACRTICQPAILSISPAMCRMVWKRYCQLECLIRLARQGMTTLPSTKKFVTARC